MENLIEFLKDINIAQIIILLVAMWFFYNRLDQKIEKTKDRIDKLSEKVEDVDRRICRIEGSLASHGHCLFNQNLPEKKAE